MRYRWAADLTSQVKVLSGIMTTFYLVNIIDVSALTIDLTPAQAAETLNFFGNHKTLPFKSVTGAP